MKRIKYFISVLLILSFIPFSHAYAQQTADDIEISLTEEYKKLQAFEIISEDDGLEYYAAIPRGLFVSCVAKCAVGYSDVEGQTEFQNPYEDVNEATDGYKGIMSAYLLGLISAGDSFRPDDDITMYEAAKILVSVLGYGELAEKKGGYPLGYMSIANNIGIFKGCNFDSEGHMPAKSFLNALMNTLETEVLDIEAITKKLDGLITTYQTVDNRTLMACSLGIYRTEGIVKSNEYTSINGLSNIDDNQIEIGSHIYLTKEASDADFLGYNVECYYKNDNTNTYREIIYINEYRNEVVKVESDRIIPDGLTSTKFTYYKDDLKRKSDDVKISRSASLIYNGGQKRLMAADLCPANGEVTLIDNNNDNNFDVVKVMNYRTILVSGVSENSHTISDLLGGTSIVLNTEDDDYEFFIEIDGEDGEFSDIAVRNVISYAESTGNTKNVKYVKVSTKTVEGMVDSVYEDTVTLDGVEYAVSENIKSSVKLRNYGIFYIDIYGRIVAQKLEKDVVYGYLNMLYKDGTGLRKRVEAQIFTENNRWVVLDFEEKVTTNSGRKTAEELYTELGSDYRQLITYTVSDSGKINMLKTAESFEEYSAAEENAIEEDIFRVYGEISSAKYRSGLKSFENLIVVGDTTKIFMVPDQSTKDADEEEFYMIPASSLSGDSTYKNIIPYDLNRSRMAGALVIVGRARSISLNSSFMVVDKMIKARDSEDNMVDAVRGHYMNSLITLPAADDDVFAAFSEPLAEGDIIQFRMDDYGNVDEVILRYDASKGFEQKFETEALYSWRNFVAGTIHYTDIENNKIIANGEEKKIIMGTNTSTVVSIYDREEKTLKTGTLSDIQKGSGFFARLSYYMIKEIIVFV